MLRRTIKIVLNERNQTHILSGPIYRRFKIRQNSSVVLEVRVMVTWAEEPGGEGRGTGVGVGRFWRLTVPAANLEGGYMGTFAS